MAIETVCPICRVSRQARAARGFSRIACGIDDLLQCSRFYSGMLFPLDGHFKLHVMANVPRAKINDMKAACRWACL